MQRLIFLFYFLFTVLTHSIQAQGAASTSAIHHTWNDLLQKHVTQDGKVNYKHFLKDSTTFNQYLHTLATNAPQPNWSKNEKMAFWINAYNAYTVQLILRHYPVKSIKDIKKGIPFINTVWDLKFIRIGDTTYDLNNIEHGILRAQFNDPRVHFALNCASFSCPKLQKEAFVAEKLEQQLDKAAQDFLKDTDKNKITATTAQLSKLFLWYRGDFTKQQSFIDFINRYSLQKINKKTKINYLEYNWDLNSNSLSFEN